MQIKSIGIGVLALGLGIGGICERVASAGEAAATRWGPYFLGHEVEPAMDYGGRVMVSLHTAASDLGGRLTRRFPYVAPAYEVPLSILISTLQHEFHGHGGRAREYGLRPSYGFGLDFSAYTTIDSDPRSMEQLAALAAGGTEANAVMARRMLLDLCRPDTLPASSVPLMWMAKLDLSVYTAITARPREDDGVSDDDDETSFVEQFEEGNDIAIYLVTRQGTRRQADPVDVWQRDYVIDFDDPQLNRTYRQTQDVAIWNALDPMMWVAMVYYVKDHVIAGRRHLPAPALPLGNGYGFTVGTRGSIEPQSVSRFLDLYLLTPHAIFSVYGRDLRSADDTAYGGGAGIYRLTPGQGAVSLSVSGDFWDTPSADEALYDGVGWNVTGEVEFPVRSGIGLAIKAGVKNAGYFPGTPTSDGLYAGGGITARF